MNVKKDRKLTFWRSLQAKTCYSNILAITTLVVSLSACDRVQQVIAPGIPQPDVLTPLEERTHVWVVDEHGVEVPVPGTWKLMAQTNPNSPFTIGESFPLPPEIPHKLLLSEGTYTDGEGILWTKATVTTADGLELVFLERVDTSVSPHQLHIVWKVTDDGSLLLAYPEYPFKVPGHNVQIWEKQ